MRYQHTHDSKIIVVGAGGVYIDTPANFAQDSGGNAPGERGIYYALGGPQCRTDEQGNQGPHGMSAGEVARAEAAIANASNLIDAQRQRAAAAQAAQLAAMTVTQKREQEYNAQGVTIGALTVALWEQIIEGRGDAAALLQAKRAAVKAAIK